MASRFAYYVVKEIDKNASLDDLMEKFNRFIPARLKIIAYALVHGMNANETNDLLLEHRQERLYARNIFDALFIAALNNKWTLNEIEIAADFSVSDYFICQPVKNTKEFISEAYLVQVRDQCIQNPNMQTVTTFLQDELLKTVTGVASFEDFLQRNTNYFTNFRTRTASVLAEQLHRFLSYVGSHRKCPIPIPSTCSNDEQLLDDFKALQLNTLEDFLSGNGELKLKQFHAAADIFFGGKLSAVFYREHGDDPFAFKKNQNDIVNGQLQGKLDMNRRLFLIMVTYINALISANERSPWFAEDDINNMLNTCGWDSLDAENDNFDNYISFLIDEPDCKLKFEINDFIFDTQYYLDTRNTTIVKAFKEK